MTHTFELGESTVTVEAPEGAEFADLEGLSAGPPPHLDGRARRVLHGLGGERLRRCPTRSTPTSRRRWPGPVRAASSTARPSTGRAGSSPRPRAPAACPSATIHELSDLLLVPGEREQLRIGYRVPEDAPEELRALLARMLDSVEVHRHA